MINEARAQCQNIRNQDSGQQICEITSTIKVYDTALSPPPVQLSVFKPSTKERKGHHTGALSLFSHQHTSPHHPLSSTHVYVSWTHITIHYSKLTTQGSGWENHCETILSWRLRPLQLPPLDSHNPWSSKVSSARTLKLVWKPLL